VSSVDTTSVLEPMAIDFSECPSHITHHTGQTQLLAIRDAAQVVHKVTHLLPAVIQKNTEQVSSLPAICAPTPGRAMPK
jgi:hypothetical protein